jgi:outer membrane receptor protein involved in Fe transport
MKLTCRTLALATALGPLPFAAMAQDFNVPSGDLKAALDRYKAQSGISLFVPREAVRGVQTHGVKGDLPPDEALTRLLRGTGFTARRDPSGMIAIIHDQQAAETEITTPNITLAQATPSQRAAVETVTVTSSKLGGADVQSIPIAITAMSQEQLTATQTAGGPDLVKQVPNLTFTKTNFTGYSIQIRGIGTQAISVSTDPAVAVALNDIPFIRNHFFEQEFYDLAQAEVLRGPQGTLYGRNATAGVVNLTTAKPSDQFEAMASGDIGNYKNRRFEGMVNLPIVDDRLDVRLAGEWTKRDGYTTNALTGDQVDGRDLWSSRLSIGWKPLENLKANLVWEHFSENDDRMRTAKQLCHNDPGPSTVLGLTVPNTGAYDGLGQAFAVTTAKLSQGCLPASLYSPESFEVPNGYSLPYVTAGYVSQAMTSSIDPYASTAQSTDLRVIETQINPQYRAKNDTIELNADYNITPSLTFTSQTGYNEDFLWSTEDYNRFNTAPGVFHPVFNSGNTRTNSLISSYSDCRSPTSFPPPSPPDGTYYFADPQLGCSNRLVAQDISREHAWQFSQEFRFASSFSGPFNFSAGGNYMHYETVEDYYVFANALTLFAATSASSDTTAWVPGVTDNSECLAADAFGVHSGGFGQQYNDPNHGAGQPTSTCYSIDPNPLDQVDDAGHNYFLSRNPYTLNSYAGFGEAYYNVLSDLKLTGGLRWTDDQKHFTDIPSELLANGYGYMASGVVDQTWKKFTGRFAANWTPKLDFTDQTLIYGSFAHGYKAGGANPPGAALYSYGAGAGVQGVPIHPLTFEPEYINAYELGSKNTLLDGSVTLNGDMFFYNYKGYQISEIVDRTSINLNFDATVKGAEIEASYEPLPGLRFHFAGGYENTRIKDGQSAVDLMDRTAGHPGWLVMKPFVTQSSNCIFPEYVVAAMLGGGSQGYVGASACGYAYQSGQDPVVTGVYHSSWDGPDDPSRGLVSGQPYYVQGTPPYTTTQGYPYPYPASTNGLIYTGFDPLAGTPGDPYTGQNTFNGVDYGPVPNNGAGFAKNVGGNELPNAPRFTISASAEYSTPITADWAGTFHVDYYWQDYSWARVFNDDPYDRIRGYTNVNLALILTNQNGWQVMGYLKNIFDTTAITGTFLNSDDSGLTTNVFLTDPRLFGVRVTKNW